MKMTKKDIAQFAKEIEELLIKYNLQSDVCLYYNGKRDISKYDKESDKDIFISEENKNPHNYFEYAATRHILSMSFEGALYRLLNGFTLDAAAEKDFYSLFNKYGLSFELGDAWNLTAFPIEDNYEDYEYMDYEYSKKPEPIYLCINNMSDDISPVFMLIMKEWYRASSEVGDIGSCVIGAGLEFNYCGNQYFMARCSPHQGSLSWENCIDIPKRMLSEIGATNIKYNPGRMN